MDDQRIAGLNLIASVAESELRSVQGAKGLTDLRGGEVPPVPASFRKAYEGVNEEEVRIKWQESLKSTSETRDARLILLKQVKATIEGLHIEGSTVDFDLEKLDSAATLNEYGTVGLKTPDGKLVTVEGNTFRELSEDEFREVGAPRTESELGKAFR